VADGVNLKLEIYEGPLDLLLHLIKRNEVGIHDIPISLITAQYIEYLDRMMDDLDLDVAGDFLIMAATLADIKSRSLLPPEGRPGDPAADPRLEIVRPLLEFAAFRAAAEALGGRPILDRDVFGPGAAAALPDGSEPAPPPEVAKAGLWQLVTAWREMARRGAEREATLSFTMETMTIGQMLAQIRQRLIASGSAGFLELAAGVRGSFGLSLCFLAVLELARTGFLRMWQDLEADRLGPRLFLADPEAAPLPPEALDYR
jgi:segregation and condensation protein A